MAIKKVKLPDNSEQDIHDARIAAIDSALSGSSTNPVQNSVIEAEFVQVTYLGDVDEEVDEIPEEPEQEPVIVIGGIQDITFNGTSVPVSNGTAAITADFAEVNGDLTEDFSVEYLTISGPGTTSGSGPNAYTQIGDILPNGDLSLDSSKRLKLTYGSILQAVGESVPSRHDTVRTLAYTSDVPTISTSITTDASSDVKTASPKAVKTYVDTMCGNIETLLAALL